MFVCTCVLARVTYRSVDFTSNYGRSHLHIHIHIHIHILLLIAGTPPFPWVDLLFWYVSISRGGRKRNPLKKTHPLGVVFSTGSFPAQKWTNHTWNATNSSFRVQLSETTLFCRTKPLKPRKKSSSWRFKCEFSVLGRFLPPLETVTCQKELSEKRSERRRPRGGGFSCDQRTHTHMHTQRYTYPCTYAYTYTLAYT